MQSCNFHDILRQFYGDTLLLGISLLTSWSPNMYLFHRNAGLLVQTIHFKIKDYLLVNLYYIILTTKLRPRTKIRM